MSDPTDPSHERVTDSTAKPPSALPAGVYMIRRGKDQKPHSISVPVTAEDVEEHRKKTGGKPDPFPLTLNDSGPERPLQEFKSSLEFLCGLRDSIVALAHKHLWMDAKKLHGNICPNVIFFNEHGKGVLVDWDHNPRIVEITKRVWRQLNYDDIPDNNSD